MKSLLAALAVTTALTFPSMALARPVTLTTTLKSYGGNGAYLAFYVTERKEPMSAACGWPAASRSTISI